MSALGSAGEDTRKRGVAAAEAAKVAAGHAADAAAEAARAAARAAAATSTTIANNGIIVISTSKPIPTRSCRSRRCFSSALNLAGDNSSCWGHFLLKKTTNFNLLVL